MTNKSISRREWLNRAATASLGTGLLAAATSTTFAADSTDSSDNKLLGARVYNIRDFGAVGDGKTLDTKAVQAAIDACAKDNGGTVLVPAGVFVIGSTELKTNVTLHISAGGKLLGSPDGKQYFASDKIPLRDGPGEHTMGDGNVGLLFAQNAENITIEGPGTIDGNGAALRGRVRGQTPPNGVSGRARPYHILFYQCKNLTIRNVSCIDCAYHSIRVCASQHVKLDGIHIRSRISSNNDGFHFISAEYVHLSNCDVECGDDACALFGSCKFVTVDNCTFSTRWSVFRFGGGCFQLHHLSGLRLPN
jgi:polygalacturonase